MCVHSTVVPEEQSNFRYQHPVLKNIQQYKTKGEFNSTY